MTDSEERIAEALRAPYTRILRAAEEGGFDAEVLEFPGCFATGDNATDAMENLDEAMGLWIEAEIEAGHDIPAPLDVEDYSGRLTLRIPPSLHRRADLQAHIEGLSLNRLLSAAIASYVGITPVSRDGALEVFRRNPVMAAQLLAQAWPQSVAIDPSNLDAFIAAMNRSAQQRTSDPQPN